MTWIDCQLWELYRSMREDVMLTTLLFVTRQEKSILFFHLPKVHLKLDPVYYLTTCLALLMRCSYSAASFKRELRRRKLPSRPPSLHGCHLRTHWAIKKNQAVKLIERGQNQPRAASAKRLPL